MEEDIKILKELIENANIEDMDMNDCFGGEHLEAIENILARLEQDEKVIERLKADYEKEVSLYNSKEQLKCNTEVMRYLEEVLYE